MREVDTPLAQGRERRLEPFRNVLADDMRACTVWSLNRIAAPSSAETSRNGRSCGLFRPAARRACSRARTMSAASVNNRTSTACSRAI
ncbi:hypothetical protein [Microbacterium sp. E-13]|uniref:hypothetical protein n=1 Tax=Microbacterium sp. E-13 TaxID=3404048 RepID=UPI003CF40E75